MFKKHCAAAVVLSMSVSASHGSEVCEGEATQVSEFVDIKRQFLDGEYENFFSGLSSLDFSDGDVESVVDTLKRAFPIGFAYCAYLVSEQVSENLNLEILLYEDENSNTIFLYLSSIRSRSGWKPVHFHVSTSFQEVADLWR